MEVPDLERDFLILPGKKWETPLATPEFVPTHRLKWNKHWNEARQKDQIEDLLTLGP